VVVVTEVFANLAATATRARGIRELRTLILPHPMETRSEDEIRRIALAAMQEMARLITAQH
jgi:hypothetical protein